MTLTLSARFTLATAVVAALLVGSGLDATAQTTQQPPPGVTVPATSTPIVQPPSTLATTTTTAPPASTSTTATLNGKAGEAGTSPGQPVPTTTSAAPPPGPSTTAPAPPPAPTVAPGPTVPPPSLTARQVDQVLRDQQRSGANSTAALVEALKPLQNLGLTLDEALVLGMGRFPLLGVANWTDDWLDHRDGPPVHQHQGTDVFAAFDIPVRAPADGVVRFEDGGLGGKGAYVTTPDGTFYYMAHLNGFNRELANGAAVKQGQIVGYNGDSGNAKGGAPHVHFEIHPRGGAAVNPKPVLDQWVAEALAKVPELIASFAPKPDAEASPGAPVDESMPAILMNTGLTRRFSPSPPASN